MRICLAALGVGVTTMIIAACSGGTVTSTTASGNAQACATLATASSSLAEAPQSETVGQAQSKLQSFSGSLTAAKAETSGVEQALIANLQARTDEALKSLNGLSATDAVPAGFAAKQSNLSSGLSELSGKLKCG